MIEDPKEPVPAYGVVVSDTGHMVTIPSDDGPVGEVPGLKILGHMDWFVGISDPGQTHSTSLVRFSTSGGRNCAITGVIALLDAVARGDRATIRSRLESVAVLCDISLPWPPGDAKPETP